MMPTQPAHRPHVRWLVRAYAALLPLLPYDLRAHHGDAMCDLFARELERSESGGRAAVWRTGVAGLLDLAGRGAYERIVQEREALTPANVALLLRTAAVFASTCVVLTMFFVTKRAITQDASVHGAPALWAAVLCIPYTAALTIPMSVFMAVLWAESRAASFAGELRRAPVVGMALVIALGCVVLNAEVVPRANHRLQAIYAGQASVAATDRSMTLRELVVAVRRAEGKSVAVTATSDASPTELRVEIHKKFAQATACVVLALLALRVGKLLRDRRVLLLVAVSVVVFAGYYVCLILGEHLADRAAVPPSLAMWSANLVMLGLAMFIARRRDGVSGRAAL